jgi:acetyltransferase-like isoleucine patch superfamily enzyme
MAGALREIGWRRAVRYALLELAMAVHAALLLAPLRAAWLRLLGARLGEGALLMDVRFSNLDRTGLPGLVIGRRCYLGRGVRLDLAERIELLDDTTLADGATVLTHLNVGYREHPLQRAFPSRALPARLGPGAFVGAGALLLPGASVGAGACVAAGAVVTRSVPDGVIVAGNPARIVGTVAARLSAAGGPPAAAAPGSAAG